ncbi:NAD(P)H-binding protein [Mitsuaria sp. GD03876]|uniref:NmrA family NAD(P)-binding protein n=1 Tax=Mitsuaria sp. GD03876 TaxID=2975399 RepID=UPI0024474D0F|nr:NAD(P)H-binding protein [Mitsuaria sp. GD03876]MDH0863339.1 NAD(P)H-binding protein [Mitsuaria sp. GD03876]
MFAIVGAAGKVGHATSLALIEAGAPVRAVLRNDAKAGPLKAVGCEVALADLQDAEALARALAGARTVQVILPPRPLADDAVADMHRSIDSLVAALERTRPERVLAISDYGAHVEEDIGMPSVFRHFEQRLRGLATDLVLLRSAEHMEGWRGLLPVAVATGVLPSFHAPVERAFPTVSAGDVGAIAAELLLRPRHRDGARVVHAEGPRRHSAADVAEALGQLLGRTVAAREIPRGERMAALGRVMSASTARLLVGVYDAHRRGGLIDVEPGPAEVRRGSTTLVDALRPVVTPR